MHKLFSILALPLFAGGLAAQDTLPPPAAPVALQSGDVLRISVWREPDLSGEFLVDESGDVVLPLLGEWRVAGIPVGELTDSLLTVYRQNLRNPSITITPLRRIYVLGEVNRPGLLAVDPTVSLAGVIALAGGTNPVGDLRRIQVIRDGTVVQNELEATQLLTQLDVRSGDQVIVGRRSWFDRNSTFFVSALLSVTSIVISLMR